MESWSTALLTRISNPLLTRRSDPLLKISDLLLPSQGYLIYSFPHKETWSFLLLINETSSDLFGKREDETFLWGEKQIKRFDLHFSSQKDFIFFLSKEIRSSSPYKDIWFSPLLTRRSNPLLTISDPFFFLKRYLPGIHSSHYKETWSRISPHLKDLLTQCL